MKPDSFVPVTPICEPHVAQARFRQWCSDCGLDPDAIAPKDLGARHYVIRPNPNHIFWLAICVRRSIVPPGAPVIEDPRVEYEPLLDPGVDENRQ